MKIINLYLPKSWRKDVKIAPASFIPTIESLHARATILKEEIGRLSYIAECHFGEAVNELTTSSLHKSLKKAWELVEAIRETMGYAIEDDIVRRAGIEFGEKQFDRELALENKFGKSNKPFIAASEHVK